MNENIVNATFTSEFDGGAYVFTTACKVNLDTKEVFDIEKYDGPEVNATDSLDREYITLPDGTEHEVCEKSEAGPGDFFYN